jgi:hypothetical protein
MLMRRADVRVFLHHCTSTGGVDIATNDRDDNTRDDEHDDIAVRWFVSMLRQCCGRRARASVGE